MMITWMHVKIVAVVMKHLKQILPRSNESTVQKNDVVNDARKIKMVCLLVICNYVTWLPTFGIALYSMGYYSYTELGEWFEIVQQISKIFVHMDSLMNPVVITVMNSEFRRSFTSMCKNT